MSFHRENIIWQSADGTWSRGFYECHESYGGHGDDDDEDSFDPEWDVEYDYGALEQVSCGHPSEDAAFQSWRGANPGLTREGPPCCPTTRTLQPRQRSSTTWPRSWKTLNENGGFLGGDPFS